MAVRLVRSLALHGVNWFCDRSVALAEITGEARADRWSAAVAIVDAVLPPGIAEAPPRTPSDTPDAVGLLAAAICRWGGFPTRPAAPRTDAGRIGWAGLPLRCAPLMAEALAIAVEAIDIADRDADVEPWLAPARSRLLAAKAEADAWMIGSRRLIAAAAEARGIPCRVHSGLRSMLVLGEGRHGHRYDASATPGSSAVATTIAISKQRTSTILARGGIPVARQAPVPDRTAAHLAADRFGLPLVLKPTIGRLQRGVSIVFRADDIDAAFDACAATGTGALAESYIPGREFRALVVGGRLVSVIEQVAARVVGDGRATIEQLVATANLDRRRGLVAEGCPMRKLAWNDVSARFLAFSGRSPDDVPVPGEVVETYPLPMLRYGGELKVDVTDTVHPETAAMLERAAALVGIDVAGIDFRTPDVAASWREVGAGICEVNPQPNLGIHYSLSDRVRRDVAGLLLDRTLPSRPAPMTHVAVIGLEDGDRVAAAIRDRLAADRGWRVALATPERVELDRYPVARVPPRFDQVVSLAIEDPTLDAGVYAVAPRFLVRFGLGLDRLDVALVGPAGPAAPRSMAIAREIARAAGARLVEADDAPPAELAGRVVAALRQGGAGRAGASS
ncbi:MAG: hypothetical protein AB7O45_04965 [Alphaproteobacteria bacterium]